jgi:hypothetical protein
MERTSNLLILIANLMVLGLVLKLYTELFKDKAIDQRVKKPLEES